VLVLVLALPFFAFDTPLTCSCLPGALPLTPLTRGSRILVPTSSALYVSASLSCRVDVKHWVLRCSLQQAQ
jgi:hypothetical protein